MSDIDEPITDEPISDEPIADEPISDEPIAEDREATELQAAVAQNRQRLAFVIVGALLLFAFGGLYLAWASGRVDNDIDGREDRALEAVRAFELSQAQQEVENRPTPAPSPTPAPTAVVPIVPAEPGMAPLPGEVLVVNRVPGDDYGRMAIRHADGTRTLLEPHCMRLHIAADSGVCLSESDDVLATYRTTFFPVINPAAELKSYESALPSRARISPDGKYSSVTAFVSGSSYEDISTETFTLLTIDEVRNGLSFEGIRSARLFEVVDAEDRYATFDAQYWGVTFSAGDDFYVTGFYGTAPEIMLGSLESLKLRPTGWIGSCPSLSPDGKTLVFKEQRQDGGFDLVAVDLETDKKWNLGETRSVDDQVEWLDNDTILYALHPEGGDTAVQPEFDIWMLDIAEGSEPVLFLPNADSPAVAR